MKDIEELIKNYEAPTSAKKIVQNLNILLIAGIAAAGKDSIMKLLLSGGQYERVITTIPRPMRPDEVNGIDYHFISDEQALANVKARKYFEAKIVHGRIYGTTVAELERVADKDKVALADVDVQGVDEFRQVGGDNVTAVFIIPPDYETWQERFLSRTPESADEIARRTTSAIKELQHALATNYYHFVVNDDLKRAARVIDQIARHQDDSPTKETAAHRVTEKLLADIVAHHKN